MMVFGGALKRLASSCKLAETSEQVLTPKQLFEFANSEIASVTTYFENSQSVQENVSFL